MHIVILESCTDVLESRRIDMSAGTLRLKKNTSMRRTESRSAAISLSNSTVQPV